MVVLEASKEVPREEEAEGPSDVLGGLDRRGHHVRHVRREELDLLSPGAVGGRAGGRRKTRKE